jgi:uncharacterized phage protein gp47/JayE
MVRPAFKPVFEESESTIMDRMIGRVSDDWRKDPGDFIYDSVAPSPLEVKQLQVNQDEVLKQSFALYAEGEYLDYKLAEVGLTRIQATQCERKLNITADAGVFIKQGYTVSVVILDKGGNPIEYTVDQDTAFDTSGTLEIAITSKLTGTVTNVPEGSEFILSPPLPGVRGIADAGITTYAIDTETDDAAYLRYQDKINNPDTGGNKNDYVRWVMKQFEGRVGAVKPIPRWNGNGTVKVIIVDVGMTAAEQELVDDVQEYLDPESQGLGEGKAPCGSAVTVVPATEISINIAATVSYDPNANTSESESAFIAAITEYLKGIVFTGSKVIYNKIGGILIATAGVSNYSGLTVNGGTADITINTEEVAIIGTVTI